MICLIWIFNQKAKMVVSTHDKEDEKQQEEEVATQTADIDLGKLSPASS
jgi:hypothetical protein